jgi:hypothetical protein
MGKSSGLGGALYISGFDVSGDIQQFTIASPRQTIDVTAINKHAMERIFGARDGSIDATTFFNPSEVAGNAIHERLSPLPTTDQLVTVGPIAVAVGAPAACLISKQLNYDGKRTTAGEVNFEVSSQSNGYGLEWGKLLTAGVRTDTGAATGTGVDFGAGSPPDLDGDSLFGLQAYLHVFSFTGTDATIKLQQSTDNGVGDAWADVTGGAFTQVTADPVFQRIATADDQAVEQWLRVTTTTTGGFTDLKFAVVVCRNDVETLF